ncbi:MULTISPECIES: helix-turn-helix transcriptional regulator [Streptomyces]|uniref:Transcriptional regulator n=2 Tax=Streptomyces TaxID=1883 RepID=A0A2U9P3F9_STRAS|nr:helix-turn-helix transcriptional regulator [Streptomyces actuosus]AWT44012.1 transcriptional regulator [Streptomyces actuosus]MBM4820846.1 helix-turn-helix domain-containing protein [Streptomyces actuosus]
MQIVYAITGKSAEAKAPPRGAGEVQEEGAAAAKPAAGAVGTGNGRSSSSEARRRKELRDFLVNRRGRLTPGDVGIPHYGRRRTPGLRREEVAFLAGVSASWYQWLEQGRNISVSPQVLDAITKVLRLDQAERTYLYVLAGLNPPLPLSSEPLEVDVMLARLTENNLPYPAFVVDPYWNLVTANQATYDLLGYRKTDRNSLVTFFTSPLVRSRVLNWAELAPWIVAQYRYGMTTRPGDLGFEIVVGELTKKSPEFAELWARHDVRAEGVNVKVVDHPELGVLHFDVTRMRIPQFPDLLIVLYNPRPEQETGVDTRGILNAAHR